jgi:hypothetical protein
MRNRNTDTQADNNKMNNLPNKDDAKWNRWYIAVAAVLVVLIIFFYLFTQQFA